MFSKSFFNHNKKMKTFFFLLLFPFFSFASLIITEVQIQGDFADHDYIKIYNEKDQEIDVSGFRLRKRTSTGTESSIRVLPQGTSILAKDYLVWANSKGDFHKDMKANVWSTAYLAKNNSIALFDTENSLLDSLSWGETENSFSLTDNFSQNPERNQALKRKRINEKYQKTNNANEDFFLDPEIIEIKKEKIILTKPELENNNFPFWNAFFLSLGGGTCLLTLKKIIKT